MHSHCSTMYHPCNHPCLSTGTTVIAATYNGGIILAADSRLTFEKFIVSDTFQKIVEIKDNVFISFSGNADDFERVLIRVQAAILIECKNKPRTLLLAYLAISLYKYELWVKYAINLEAEIILVGWTEDYGGEIYHFPEKCVEAMQTKYVLLGSGSDYLTGLFDYIWDEKMDAQKCKEFVIDAISIAYIADYYTGGDLNLVMINSEGAKRSSPQCTTLRFLGLPEPRDSLLNLYLKFVASIPLPDLNEEDEEWLNS